MNGTRLSDSPVPRSVRIRRYLRQLALRVLVYVAAYLLIAILTIGPCFWYWFGAIYMGGPRWIAKFYAPLLWLCELCWPLCWLVNQYINWWIL